MANRCSLARRMLSASIGLAIVWLASNVYHATADDKYERGRMEDIMDVVAKDIQKKFSRFVAKPSIATILSPNCSPALIAGPSFFSL